MYSDAAEIVLFGVFGVILGGFIEFILKWVHSPIPYTVLVFYCGIILAGIRSKFDSNVADFVQSATVSSDLIVFGFLPALLFSETMNLNLHHVQKGFSQSVILAGPGGLVVAFQLGIVACLCLPFGWSWSESFLFGAILCATDPVSVVNLLKTVKASSKLTTIIAGESLLNDGSAMTLYFFFANLLNGHTYTPGSLILFIFEMIFVSPAIGFCFGYVTYRVMKKLTRPTDLNMDLQIIVTIVCGYASFYVAEGPAKVSGVLSCCTAGVTLALLVSPRLLLHEKMHEVWGTIEWICNTLIFLLGGMVGGTHALSNVTGTNIGYLVLMYVFLIVSRYIMVFAFYPAISKIGLKCSWNEAIFVGYSGMRGALAIALASLAASDDDTNDDGYTKFGGQMFFLVAGLVSMTLLFNGSTAGLLLRMLRLVENPDAKPSAQLQQVLDRIKSSLTNVVKEDLSSMKSELGDYDVKEVSRLCQLMDYDLSNVLGADDRNSTASEAEVPMEQRNTDEGSKHLMRASGTMESDNDLLAYVRSTFLDTVRSRYLESIENGKIGSSAFSSKLLLYSVDVAQDHVKRALTDWESIQSFLKPNKYYLRFCQLVDNFFYTVGLYPGLVSKLDARTERVAIYVLINYIDAHEYAQSQMHYFLGGPMTEGEFDIAGPEEAEVRRESELLVDKAKYLLRSIDQNDVKKIYTHRAAMVIVMRQTEILDRMIKEGAITEKNARHLFKTIERDRERIDEERHTYDRGIVAETKLKKLTIEKEKRESFVRMNSFSGGGATPTPDNLATPKENGAGGGGGGGGEGDGMRASFRDNLEDFAAAGSSSPIRIKSKKHEGRNSPKGGDKSETSTPVNSPPTESTMNPLVLRKNPQSFDMSDSESRTQSVADDGGI